MLDDEEDYFKDASEFDDSEPEDEVDDYIEDEEDSDPEYSAETESIQNEDDDDDDDEEREEENRSLLFKCVRSIQKRMSGSHSDYDLNKENLKIKK